MNLLLMREKLLMQIGQKNGPKHYGYKDHAKVDNKNKFIDEYKVINESEHDSQALDDLLDEEKYEVSDLWADSTYTGENQDKL